MRNVTVAVMQMACSDVEKENLDKMEMLIRQAAGRGAQIVLPQELLAGPYFCKEQKPEHFARARTVEESAVVARMLELARELQVVIPASFFEKAGRSFYNSLAVIDADGEMRGVYRKTHIPQGPGYEEKYYFTPGDTGFKVWQTRYATIGVGICWDQWFPEAARCMVLMGAELLLYPTAIGSEPAEPGCDTSGHWRRVMQGHAGANIVPVAASNRIGQESSEGCSMTFYGKSFIAGPTGKVVAEGGGEEEVLTAAFDLDAIESMRAGWGFFRDRRPSCYGPLLQL